MQSSGVSPKALHARMLHKLQQNIRFIISPSAELVAAYICNETSITISAQNQTDKTIKPHKQCTDETSTPPGVTYLFDGLLAGHSLMKLHIVDDRRRFGRHQVQFDFLAQIFEQVVVSGTDSCFCTSMRKNRIRTADVQNKKCLVCSCV